MRTVISLLTLCLAADAFAGIILPDGDAREPLLLRKEIVTVEVDDQLARTTIDQVFENRADHPVDGHYVFPVPDGAGVAGFATYIDGQRVESQMKEKHAAAEAFDAARQAGRGAALVEVGGTNRFTTRVANIAAGGTRRVELRYDEVLRYDSGKVSYLLPLRVPGVDAHLIGQLTVDVVVRDQKEIGEVRTPDAWVRLETTRVSPHEVRLHLAARDLVPPSDLRVDYTVRSKDVGVRFVAHRPAGEDGTFLVTFAPQEETVAADIVNRDVTFVFDISGSMAGKKIEQARRALLLCLGNLHAGDRFDIIAFDDRVELFRPQVVPATADALQAARSWVGDMHDRGGTNIHDALLAAFESFGESSRTRTIIFLTDGQATSGVTATVRIVEDVQAANTTGARLFTFGVGDSIDRELLERLATTNRGAVEYIDSNEGIDARVGRFYKRIAEPVLSNLKVSFGAQPVSLIYPHTLPDLYKGLELVLVGRFAGPGAADELVLSGDLNGARKEYRAKVQFPSVQPGNPFLARVWARQRIEALLGEVRLEGETPARKDEVIQLAERFNIATPYTSFVADAKKELAELTPDRVQPGDPEVDIHAPANALGVTLIFPFGLTKAATWEAKRGTWTCRFLVPRDTPDGVYDVKVAVTLADRRVEWLQMRYVVDTAAPVVTVTVRGMPQPGRTVELVARQVITDAEVKTQKGEARPRAQVRPDLKALAAVLPDGRVVRFTEDRTGAWHATMGIPVDALGPLTVRVRAVDVADNAREQATIIPVRPTRRQLARAASVASPSPSPSVIR